MTHTLTEDNVKISTNINQIIDGFLNTHPDLIDSSDEKDVRALSNLKMFLTEALAEPGDDLSDGSQEASYSYSHFSLAAQDADKPRRKANLLRALSAHIQESNPDSADGFKIQSSIAQYIDPFTDRLVGAHNKRVNLVSVAGLKTPKLTLGQKYRVETLATDAPVDNGEPSVQQEADVSENEKISPEEVGFALSFPEMASISQRRVDINPFAPIHSKKQGILAKNVDNDGAVVDFSLLESRLQGLGKGGLGSERVIPELGDDGLVAYKRELKQASLGLRGLRMVGVAASVLGAAFVSGGLFASVIFGGGENSQVDLVEAASSSAAALLTAEAPTDRLNNYVEPVATIQSVEKRSTPEAVQATEVPTVQTSYAGMGAFGLGDLVSYKANIVNLSTMSEPHLKVSSVGDYTMNSPHVETEAPVKLVEKLPELFTAMAAPDELLVAPERDLSEQRGIDRNVLVEVAFSEAALKTTEVLEEVTPDAVPEAFEKVLIEEGDSVLKIAARDLREQGVETEVEPAKVIERMAQYAQINGPDFASKPHLLKAGDYLLVPKINGQTADCNLNRVFARSGEACEIVKVGAEMGTKALANNYTVTYDPKPGAS